MALHLPPLAPTQQQTPTRQHTQSFLAMLGNYDQSQGQGQDSREVTSDEDNDDYYVRDVNATDYYKSSFPNLLQQIGPPSRVSSGLSRHTMRSNRELSTRNYLEVRKLAQIILDSAISMFQSLLSSRHINRLQDSQTRVINLQQYTMYFFFSVFT